MAEIDIKFMMNINWKKALGFGVLIWIVMFVAVSIFVAYGGTPSGGPMPMATSVIVTIISLVAVYFVARYIAPSSYSVAVQYGFIFAVVGIVLDFLISQRFAPDIFSSIYYWISYVLIVLVPMLAVKKNLIQK